MNELSDSERMGGQTAVEYAIERIRSAIIDGTYAPGQRLIEGDVTKVLNVSRGTVRQAMRRLTGDGLVAIEPHRGVIVCQLSKEDIIAVFQVREVLEGLAAKLAATLIGHGKNRVIAEEALKTLREKKSDDKFADFMEENEWFHKMIHELSGNNIIGRHPAFIQLPVTQRLFLNQTSQAQLDTSTREHIEILSAIIEGNLELAEERAVEHVRRTAETVNRLPNSIMG